MLPRSSENVPQTTAEAVPELAQLSSVRELFTLGRETKKYDFYKHFLRPELVAQVATRLRRNYPAPVEEFDPHTGELLEHELSQEEMRAYLQTQLVDYVLDSQEVTIQFIEGVPVAFIPEAQLRPEFAEAGAFVLGDVALLGAGVVETGDEIETALNLQHELVHLFTRMVSLGQVKSVAAAYNEFYEVTNTREVNRAELAHRFVDEALAYGVNAYARGLEITPELVARNMFYSQEPELAGYDLESNAELWADVLNETIRDRTGKKQYKLNLYLTRRVRTLDDLDLTDPETRGVVENLWSWS